MTVKKKEKEKDYFGVLNLCLDPRRKKKPEGTPKSHGKPFLGKNGPNS
jgi:hypothetical protein